MAVRGDSTLMDASSASGCDFPYGVFPSSKSLITGERRSTLGEFFFSLIICGMWLGGMITLPHEPATGHQSAQLSIFRH